MSVEQLLGAAGLDLNDQPADFLPADCKEVLMTIWRPIASVQAMAALAPAGAVVVGMAAVFQCHMLALLASSLLCVDLMAQHADNERRFPGTTKPVKLLPVLSGRYNLKSSMGEWILVDGKWATVGVAEKSGTVGPEVCFFELDKNGKPHWSNYEPHNEGGPHSETPHSDYEVFHYEVDPHYEVSDLIVTKSLGVNSGVKSG